MRGNVLLALCDTCSDWVSNDLSTRASPGSCRKTSRLTSQMIWVVQRDLMEEFKRKNSYRHYIYSNTIPLAGLFFHEISLYTPIYN